jgi:dinuclear metal center YbgI/SA1388 family protein
MPKAALKNIVRYCDRILRTDKVNDYSGAVNGLQAENRGGVTRIAAAVDASLSTIKLAIDAHADLLLVHHGLFWTPRYPWTTKNYELLQLLISNNLAVYSSHLPLDMHPRLGNNARLCAALGLRNLRPFFFDKNQHLGLRAMVNLPLEQLARRLQAIVGGKPTIIPGGPSLCRHVGVVTGGAGAEMKIAVAEGVDTFITGEGPHWTFALAEELGVNVLYGGHYATETFGVKALAADLSRKFGLPWSFIDYPTGL